MITKKRSSNYTLKIYITEDDLKTKSTEKAPIEKIF